MEIQLTPDQKVYLNRMASQLNFNLTEARERQLAKATSQNDMNKIIFENLDKWKKEAQQLDQSYNERKYLQTQFKQHKAKILQQAAERLEQYNKDIRVATAKMNEAFIYRSSIQSEIYAIENKEDLNLLEQINTVLKDSYFELDDKRSTDHNVPIFITKETYLSYVNEEAKVKIENVNLGRFLITADISRGLLRVHKYSKNISVDEFYHPHVNKDGNVCWGNAAEIVNGAFSSFNLVPLMQALKVILTTYNVGSPYRSIERFDIQLHPDRYPLQYAYQISTMRYRDDYNFYDGESESDYNGFYAFNLKNIHPDSIRSIIINDDTFRTLSEALEHYTYHDLLENLYGVEFNYYKATRTGQPVSTNLLKCIDGTYKDTYNDFFYMSSENQIIEALKQGIN